MIKRALYIFMLLLTANLMACSDGADDLHTGPFQGSAEHLVRVKLHIFSHDDMPPEHMSTLLIPSFKHLSYRYLFKAAHGGHVVSFQLDKPLLESKLQAILALPEIKSVKLDLVAPVTR